MQVTFDKEARVITFRGVSSTTMTFYAFYKWNGEAYVKKTGEKGRTKDLTRHVQIIIKKNLGETFSFYEIFHVDSLPSKNLCVKGGGTIKLL